MAWSREEVDVTGINVVVEPLLGDAKLLSDVRDGEIAVWPTGMRRGALQEDPRHGGECAGPYSQVHGDCGVSGSPAR